MTGLEIVIGYTCVLLGITMFVAPIMFVRKPKVVMASPSVGIMDDIFNDPDTKGLMRAKYEMRKYR